MKFRPTIFLATSFVLMGMGASVVPSAHAVTKEIQHVHAKDGSVGGGGGGGGVGLPVREAVGEVSREVGNRVGAEIVKSAGNSKSEDKPSRGRGGGGWNLP